MHRMAKRVRVMTRFHRTVERMSQTRFVRSLVDSRLSLHTGRLEPLATQTVNTL